MDKKFIACILDTKETGGWVGGWIVCAFVPEWDVCWGSVGGETEKWEGDGEVYAPLEWNETCVGRD